jgi:uncharacterized Tic20 family protein
MCSYLNFIITIIIIVVVVVVVVVTGTAALCKPWSSSFFYF